MPPINDASETALTNYGDALFTELLPARDTSAA
jgi:hypothetical protein